MSSDSIIVRPIDSGSNRRVPIIKCVLKNKLSLTVKFHRPHTLMTNTY